MVEHLVLLSVPGLRERDVAVMPHLRELMAGGLIQAQLLDHGPHGAVEDQDALGRRFPEALSRGRERVFHGKAGVAVNRCKALWGMGLRRSGSRGAEVRHIWSARVASRPPGRPCTRPARPAESQL